MTLNKNKTRKAVVACYATEWDVKHPTILRIAYIANIIPKEQFQQILQVDNQIDIELTNEQLAYILENYFGFSCGEYEEHLIEGSQVNKIGGGRIENVKRYTGFQFGCAVSTLAQTWKHGEELRRVHNKKSVS